MRVQNEIDRFSLVKAVVKALGKDESEKALVNEMNALNMPTSFSILEMPHLRK